ncbi:hypothetical protein L1987_05694 [Smallanthus sonchifolius]|uniref:Uncharacterized protein n=1 Tax=Smallanthus sonchifolius TaxID=185202 RepID=A0ACB9JW48_9ASTR|nr:hypothetical protein L1987_05694 [Smallanthus sonchifolius]
MQESEETRRKRDKMQVQRKPTPTGVSLRHQRKLTPLQLCLLYDLVRLMTKPSSKVGMDRNYHDNQYYYEPCNNCGITGHWAQDCPRYNSHGGGPEYEGDDQSDTSSGAETGEPGQSSSSFGRSSC